MSTPIIPATSREKASTFERSRMLDTSRAASRSASTRPSARSRSYLPTTLASTKRYSGTRRATSSRTAASPCWSRRSHGSSPVGSTATYVWDTKFWSPSKARSAAFCPAASPSKVKITSPRNSSWSIRKRRSTRAWSSPKAVPQVATAVGTPARWQAITSV